MRKLIERLLLFFVGIPIIIASIFFLPQCNYLVLHIELLAFTALAVLEMRNLLSNRLPVHSVPIALALGLVIPFASFLYAVVGFPIRIITVSIAIATVCVFFIEFIFSFNGKMDSVIGRIGSTFIYILYPGYLVMYLAIMTVWPHAGAILSVFFLMVFGCDSLAWFFGMLFGKNNRRFLRRLRRRYRRRYRRHVPLFGSLRGIHAEDRRSRRRDRDNRYRRGYHRVYTQAFFWR
jgi:phosphatidate cytidylyltransferase